MEVQRRMESSMPKLEIVEGDNASEGTYHVFKTFKALYLDGRVTQDDSKEKFHEECKKLLENGYKFRYILISSYISELASAKTFSRKSLQNAKKAFECLLPYGVNLCRFPEQKEYKLIKKYTAYFCCNIEDNLSPSPQIADTILQGMGYKLAESKDEFILPKVSQLICEICFELQLGQIELDRIMSVLEFGNRSFEISDEETIGFWEDYVQSKRSVWCLKDCKEFIKEKVYQRRRNAKKSSQMKSHLSKEKITSEQRTAAKCSGPQSLPDVIEQKKRTYERSNPEEWMYATEPFDQYSSNSQKGMTVPSDRSTHAKYRHQAGSPERSQQKCVIDQTFYNEEGTDRSVNNAYGGNTICRPPPSPNSPPYPNHIDHYPKSGKPVDDLPMCDVNVTKKDLEHNATDELIEKYRYKKASRVRSNSMTSDRPKFYKPEMFDSRVNHMPPPSNETQRENKHLQDYRSMDGLAGTNENVSGSYILQDKRNNDAKMPIDSTARALTSNGKQDVDSVNARMRTSPLPYNAPEIHQAQFIADLPSYYILQDMKQNEFRMSRDSTGRPLTSSGEQDADNAIARMRTNPLPPNVPDIYQTEFSENVPGHHIYQDKRTNDAKTQRDSTGRLLTSNSEQAANNLSTHLRSSVLPPNPPDIYRAELNDAPGSYALLPDNEAQREQQFRGGINLQSKSEPMRTVRVDTTYSTHLDRGRNYTHGAKMSRDTIEKSLTSSSKHDSDTRSIRTASRKEHLMQKDYKQAESFGDQYIQEVLSVDPAGQGTQKYTQIESRQNLNTSANRSSQYKLQQQPQRIDLKEIRVPFFEESGNFDVKKHTPAIYGGPAKSVSHCMVDEKNVVLEKSKRSMPNEYEEVHF